MGWRAESHDGGGDGGGEEEVSGCKVGWRA